MIESRCGVCCSQCNDNCEGCMDISNPAWGQCDVKLCCEKKGLLYCGECVEFPCELYADPHNKKRIAQIYEWKNNIINSKQKYIKEKIETIYNDLLPITTSKAVVKMAGKLMKELPENDDEYIDLCDYLVRSNQWIMFQMVTTWIKIRKTVYKIKYFSVYQSWLLNYTKGWGACDILCYRVLNPMAEKFDVISTDIEKWAISDKVYVRRASVVCFINPSGYSCKVNVPFNRIKNMCDIHLEDKHPHIQKAIGWLLKYSYLTYPKETEEYLKVNFEKLSRTTFRYALEKMEPKKRKYYMEYRI